MRQSTGCSPIAQQSAVAAAIRFGAYAFLRSLTSKSLREQILIVRRASIVHINFIATWYHKKAHGAICIHLIVFPEISLDFV